MAKETFLTGVERTFDPDDIIVSKTDLKGKITYANKVFLDVAGYTLKEVMHQPHNMIRHPDMPRIIFKLLWDHVSTGKELFAYVMNRCKNGDHYWVLAHVTPSFNEAGEIIGYHSNRRIPKRDTLESFIIPLYMKLKAIEDGESDRKAGMAKAHAMLEGLLVEKNMRYDEFILSI